MQELRAAQEQVSFYRTQVTAKESERAEAAQQLAESRALNKALQSQVRGSRCRFVLLWAWLGAFGLFRLAFWLWQQAEMAASAQWAQGRKRPATLEPCPAPLRLCSWRIRRERSWRRLRRPPPSSSSSRQPTQQRQRRPSRGGGAALAATSDSSVGLLKRTPPHCCHCPLCTAISCCRKAAQVSELIVSGDWFFGAAPSAPSQSQHCSLPRCNHVSHEIPAVEKWSQL